MTAPRVAMLLVARDVVHDNRVRREARTVAALGHEVHVLAQTRGDLPQDDGVTYTRVPVPDPVVGVYRARADARAAAYRAAKAARLAAPSRRADARWVWSRAALAVSDRLLTVGRLRRRVRKQRSLAIVRQKLSYWRAVRPLLEELRPDVVHAHDLKTLYAGARYARHAGVPLVYDAHEFEIYSMAVRTRYERLVAWVFERYGARRTRAVITVGDEIADELARIHGIPRPFVVLNTPSIETAAGTPERSLRELAGVRDGDLLLAYVGGVHASRGTIQLVDALALLPADVHLAVLGPRLRAEDDALRERAAEQGVGGRLHLLPPVPGSELPAILGTADAAVVPIAPSCRSYELCMPNKLFESLMAGIPIAVSARPGMARFVAENELGVVFDESSPASIAEAVRAVVASTPPGVADPARLRATQERFSWESQAPVLAEVYRRALTAA